MAVTITLTEPYYRDFHRRKGSCFDDQEAVEIYKATQELQKNWPYCLGNAQIPPDIVKEDDFYYCRFNFISAQQIKFRVCFRTEQKGTDTNIVVLTCRTKQELSGGSKTGTDAWKLHMKTVGKSRWNNYRKNKIRSWKIY